MCQCTETVQRNNILWFDQKKNANTTQKHTMKRTIRAGWADELILRVKIRSFTDEFECLFKNGTTGETENLKIVKVG